MGIEVERMIVDIFGNKAEVTESSLRHDIGVLCCGDDDHFHQFERMGIEARMASDKEYHLAIAKLADIMHNIGEKPICR